MIRTLRYNLQYGSQLQKGFLIIIWDNLRVHYEMLIFSLYYLGKLDSVS